MQKSCGAPNASKLYQRIVQNYNVVKYGNCSWDFFARRVGHCHVGGQLGRYGLRYVHTTINRCKRKNDFEVLLVFIPVVTEETRKSKKIKLKCLDFFFK